MNLVRSISFKKKPIKDSSENANRFKHEKIHGKPTRFGKKAGAGQRDLEKLLAAKIEAPLAIVVKTISTEIVKPLSKALTEAWNADTAEMFGPLSQALVDPRDVIATINFKDMSESFSEVLAALIKKLSDDVLVPFLVVVRVFLESILGERYTEIVAWLEKTVRSIIPEILKAIHGDKNDSKAAKWVNAITDDLLQAIVGPPKSAGTAQGLGKSQSKSSTKATISAPGSFKSPSNMPSKVIVPSTKLKPTVEESLDGSLKETLEDFKVHMDEALK
ncbi:hypothetical protein OXX79_002149 [Metschnikowia pulcherrima]